MLLQESRRAARTSPAGELDPARPTRTARSGTASRSRKGSALVERALASRRFGPYTLQAAIAAVHAEARAPRPPTGARSSGSTTSCCAAEPSPVVELNRAVAVAMRDGPAAGPRADRRHPRARRSRGLPPGARRAGGPLPAAGPDARGPRLLRAGARARPAGAGAAISRAAPGRAARLTRLPGPGPQIVASACRFRVLPVRLGSEGLEVSGPIQRTGAAHGHRHEQSRDGCGRSGQKSGSLSHAGVLMPGGTMLALLLFLYRAVAICRRPR